MRALALCLALFMSCAHAAPIDDGDAQTELEMLAALEADWQASRSWPLSAEPEGLALSFQPPAELTSRDTNFVGDAETLAPIKLPDLSEVQVPVSLVGPVREYIAFFQGRGRRIYAHWLARMGRYRELMLPILERHGIPGELLYICMIESGFGTGAVSHAGAVGPWQFMQRTGTNLGLRYDAWVDGRRDFEASTDAAARLFVELHERFHSWPLAMAAYNAGVGRVSRAVEKYNNNDFWRLSAMGALTTEATNYVPKAMAAMIIGQAPELYGFGDVVPLPPVQFVRVQVPAQTRLDTLAKKLGLDSDTLAALNPELRRGMTPPGGDYTLRLPPGSDERLDSALTAASKPGVFVEYSMRFGERLRDVAQSCGLSLHALRQLNDGIEGEVAPGQAIVIPQDCTPKTPNDSFTVVRNQSVAFDSAGRREVFFAARERMELSEIAAFFRVSPGHLALWNSLDPEAYVQRGMVLRIFVDKNFDDSTALLVPRERITFVAPGSQAVKKELEKPEVSEPIIVERVIHIVKKGENLWGIAKLYKVSVDAIRAENGMDPDEGVVIGLRLVIPSERNDKSKSKNKNVSRETLKPTNSKTPEKSRPSEPSGKSHTVKAGDSLWSISRTYGITIDALKKANGWGSSVLILPGQVIRLP